MRAVLLSVVLSFTACASTSTGPRPVNVHSVRVAIKKSIDASPGADGPRAIISMGKVTEESAVIYTDSPTRGRHEETWVKASAGWTLQTSRDIAASR